VQAQEKDSNNAVQIQVLFYANLEPKDLWKLLKRKQSPDSVIAKAVSPWQVKPICRNNDCQWKPLDTETNVVVQFNDIKWILHNIFWKHSKLTCSII